MRNFSTKRYSPDHKQRVESLVVKTIVVKRVARSSHMNIISIAPKKYARIPVYSKGMKERDTMIKEYYQYCDMTDSVINEENL